MHGKKTAMQAEFKNSYIEELAETAVNLHAEILENALDIASVSRSRAARAIAKAEPSPLNAAFIKIMDDPIPLYSALRDRGLDDWAARLRIAGLATSAAGGYGLKPSDFQI